MRVDIWADVICPWCGLGNKRLSDAIASFAHADDVELVHHSFQLDPSFPPGETMPVGEMLAAKGYPPDQLEASQQRLEAMAAEEGMTPYRVRENRVGNTQLTHEFLAYAVAHGRDDAWTAMYHAYFGDARNVFDLETLVELAGELGLDQDDVRDALTSGRHRAEVLSDMRRAAQLGARGVPFVVIDGRYGVSGAQSREVFLSALDEAWETSDRVSSVADGDACAID